MNGPLLTRKSLTWVEWGGMSKVAQRLRAWTQNQATAIVGYYLASGRRFTTPFHHCT